MSDQNSTTFGLPPSGDRDYPPDAQEQIRALAREMAFLALDRMGKTIEGPAMAIDAALETLSGLLLVGVDPVGGSARRFTLGLQILCDDRRPGATAVRAVAPPK